MWFFLLQIPFQDAGIKRAKQKEKANEETDQKNKVKRLQLISREGSLGTGQRFHYQLYTFNLKYNTRSRKHRYLSNSADKGTKHALSNLACPQGSVLGIGDLVLKVCLSIPNPAENRKANKDHTHSQDPSNIARVRFTVVHRFHTKKYDIQIDCKHFLFTVNRRIRPALQI